MARAGIALRKFGQEIIEGLAGERVHPSWIVPGGVNAPLDVRGARPHSRRPAGRPRDRARGPWRSSRRVLDRFADEIANFGTEPTMYAGMVDDAAACSGTTAC